MNTPKLSRTRLPAALLLILCLAAPSCGTTDPAFFTPEGRPLRELTPAAYRLAVAPIRADTESAATQPAARASLPFAYSMAGLRAQIIADLQEQQAASEVFAVGDAALEEARDLRADLLLRVRVTAVDLSHVGSSGGAILAGFLWLTTWVGGTLVQDSTYSARLEVECEFVNPYDSRVLDSLTASSERVDLSFWDRNGLLSFGMLQSLVLPPSWTSDDAEKTGRALSARAAARVAAQLTSYLKLRLPVEARAGGGEFVAESPVNGSRAGPVTRLKGKIVALEPVTAVNVFLNDGARPVLELGADTNPPIPAITEQRRGGSYCVPVEQRIALAPGTNRIVVEFAVRGALCSRTLVVFQGTETR